MKRLINICFYLLSAIACGQIEQPSDHENNLQTITGSTYTAVVEAFGAERDAEQSGESPQTKTALQGNSVIWNTGDQIAIFQGVSAADKYQIKEDSVGSSYGTFEIIAKGDETTASELQTNIAIYPYKSDLSCTPVTAEDGSATAYQIGGITIPSTQTYAANSFADDAFLMTAITNSTEDHILRFKNICGILKLQLKGTAKVKSIELKGNDNEPLSGEAIVTVYPDGTKPAIAMSQDASKTITLNCGDGVLLNETTATEFLIVIPPTAFEKGFTATISAIDEKVAIVQTSKPNEVKRSYVHTMLELAVAPEWAEVDESVLTGISIACLGDSITSGVGASYNPYPTQLRKRLNANVVNLGISATSLCEGGHVTCSFTQLTEANCADRNVVTILLGVNDWAHSRNNAEKGVYYYHLGDINSTETNCIYGAMKMWCNKILELKNTESCANTKFYFMTPTITSWNSSVTKERDWDQSKTNVHGYTLRDLCEVIIDVSTQYGIPVIDLNRCSGIYYNSETDENVTLYGGDGVHINEAGHTMVTDAIIRALARDAEF